MFTRAARLPALFALLGLCAAQAFAAAPKRPPNILFILCDDLGYGDLGCFGSPVIKTPHLDRLAAEGMKLTHCYAAAPVCSPSRAAILTGRTPYRLGIRDWIPPRTGVCLRRGEVTIAELLKPAGYRTALIGKLHVTSTLNGAEPTPADQGFDWWMCTQNNAAPTHQDPTNFIRNGQPVGPLKGHSTTLIVDEAIRFLDAGQGEPFLLFVWFHAPHEVIATPEEFTRLYPGFDDPTQPIYYGSVSLVDHEVGRLMKHLDDRSLRENTFVMFTSDNGPETLKRYRTGVHSHGSPGPLRGMKLHLYEGGYRVPGIIRWPGHTQAGRVCAEPVNGTDLLPTFCALAGVQPPRDRALDGASLLPVFAGKALRRKVPLYWQYDKALSAPWTVALRDGSWKLLANGALDRFECYHLADDPAETRDVSASEPRRVRQLAARLRKLHAEVNAEGARSGNPLSPAPPSRPAAALPAN